MIDPNIALSVKPLQIDTHGIVNMIQQGRNQALTTAQHAQQMQIGQQQLQAGALHLQEQQRDFAADEAGRKMFAAGDPTDSQIMSTYGPVRGAAILKSRMEASKFATDIQETKSKIAAAEQDYAGSLGAMIRDSGNDPAAAELAFQHAEAAGYGNLVKPLRAQVAQHPEVLGALADHLIAQSPKQQELANQRTTAGAAKTRADIAATAEDRAAAEQNRKNDAVALATAAKQGPDALAAALQQLSEAGRVEPFMGVSAKSKPQDILRLGMTADEAARADQSAITFDEQKRHNMADESVARVNAAVAQGRLKQEQMVNGMKYGPGTQEYWVQQLQENPDSIKEMPPEFRSSVGQKFRAATGLPLPTPLSGATQTQETAARNALDGAAFIRQAMQNPEVRAQIGPIMGRLGSAEQRIGTAVGLSPEAEQLAQELRTRMRYFVFQEGKAVLGGRLPQQLMGQLEQSSPNVKMDPNMLLGAVKGAEDNAQSVMDNADKQRFGGKMRSREVRGTATAPASGHVIEVNGKHYQYKGSGPTDSMDSYTEVKQ